MLQTFRIQTNKGSVYEFVREPNVFFRLKEKDIRTDWVVKVQELNV